VATFVTLVTTSGGDTYQTSFTAPTPVCNPTNLVNPTNVFQLKGDRTTVYTPFGGQPLRGEDAAYQADR
jgi:L-aminopeptidase/D-esterase-like protein